MAKATKPTCDSCRFFGSRSLGQGSCHIRSTPDRFPTRQTNDWCGEHEPLIAAATEVVIHNVGPADLVSSSDPDHGEDQG